MGRGRQLSVLLPPTRVPRLSSSGSETGSIFPWVLGGTSCRDALPSPGDTPSAIARGTARCVCTGRALGAPTTPRSQGGTWASPPQHPLPPGFRTRWCPALSKPAWRLSRSTSLYCPLLYCVFYNLKVCGHCVQRVCWRRFSSSEHSLTSCLHRESSQVMLVVKNPPASAGDAGDTGSIPESESFPRRGDGNPLQCFCLGNPMDGRAWVDCGPRGCKELDTTERQTLLSFRLSLCHLLVILPTFQTW